MSDTITFLAAIRKILEELKEGKLSEQDFVDRYNDLMADDLPDEIDRSGNIYRLLDDYLMRFAFYQKDLTIRAEHPGDLYGPEELRQKAQSLLEQLRCVHRGGET